MGAYRKLDAHSAEAIPAPVGQALRSPPYEVAVSSCSPKRQMTPTLACSCRARAGSGGAARLLFPSGCVDPSAAQGSLRQTTYWEDSLAVGFSPRALPTPLAWPSFAARTSSAPLAAKVQYKCFASYSREYKYWRHSRSPDPIAAYHKNASRYQSGWSDLANGSLTARIRNEAGTGMRRLSAR